MGTNKKIAGKKKTMAERGYVLREFPTQLPNGEWTVAKRWARPEAEETKLKKSTRKAKAEKTPVSNISKKAFVADTAYVSPRATIEGSVKILDNARIEDAAVISGSVVVSGNARIS